MSEAIAIVGAGLGGLSAAIHLAAAGRPVHIFEKNARPGGKMNLFEQDGYRFDTGPSLLTLPQVIDQLFAAAGLRREEFLQIEPVQPVCRYFWEDGSRLDALADPVAMEAAIARMAPEERGKYRDYLRYCRRIYDITSGVFLYTPIHEWRKLLTVDTLKCLLKTGAIDSLRSVNEAVSGYFADPRLRQLFNRYATYNGSDPYVAPATLNIIPYVELGLGGFYIRGGMYRLVEVLADVARSLGVVIHTEAPVERILVRKGVVQGVRVNGTSFPAPQVVCNADVVEAHNTLLEGGAARRRRLNRLEPSISGMVFLWGVQRLNPQLAHHNIFFSSAYEQEFRQIFRERSIPDDPTVYVSITARSEEQHAPAGRENWFVLLNMPYLDGQDWQAAIPRMRAAALQRLRTSGVDISGYIELEKVLTPEDFHRLYGSNRGSIYGLSSNKRSTAFRRPANRSRSVQGLYFAGGSTHPGGGVPLVLLSGKMCAGLILERHYPHIRRTAFASLRPEGTLPVV